ncbi:MAG: AAA family ATPase, partial [Acidobacteria bacterium]|nr:AAA family ATPase [Acidobacteriota bacterium]
RSAKSLNDLERLPGCMAERNYLVEGLSGAGKSSVYEELIRRGYKAISTDRAWKVHAGPETGLPAGPSHYDDAVWDPQKAVRELESPEPDVLFVCGSSRNRDRFLRYFTKIFNLRIDDDTMRRRLQERTNNDFGKEPKEVELMLRLNRSDEKPAGAIDVDATQVLDQVVDELLRLANCRTVAGDSTLTPWSKRGSVIGQSFVISESALPIVQAAGSPRKRILRGTSDEFWDVLGRETITGVEYAWSGHVLATLLPYLDEQGIDLLHSDHDEAASILSRTREGSVFVLTSDHRERYLARLDPSAFDGAVLRRYYEKFNETAAEGVDYAMLDGIAFFRDTLAPLESAILAVFIIG